ncbi:MAG: hypothetical protein GY853_14465 [PVC group bacterium]|nr:hypothetical protein [PVC group bacterium]
MKTKKIRNNNLVSSDLPGGFIGTCDIVIRYNGAGHKTTYKMDLISPCGAKAMITTLISKDSINGHLDYTYWNGINTVTKRLSMYGCNKTISRIAFSHRKSLLELAVWDILQNMLKIIENHNNLVCYGR